MAGVYAKRLWVNLLLVLMVAGLSLGAWWYQQRPAGSMETLLNLSLNKIGQVTLERQPVLVDVPKIRFEKQNGVWYMVAPRKVPANLVRLQQLFTLLDEPVAARYDAAGRDLTQYGLLPGAVTIRFNQQQLILGEENVVSNKRYVLHDNQIKLVSEMVYGSVLSEWINFVSLQLIPPQRSVTAVELPETYAVTPALASSWQAASAIRLAPLSPDTELGKAEKVILTLDNERELVFWLLETGDEWVLAQPERGVRYFIPSGQANELWPER